MCTVNFFGMFYILFSCFRLCITAIKGYYFPCSIYCVLKIILVEWFTSTSPKLLRGEILFFKFEMYKIRSNAFIFFTINLNAQKISNKWNHITILWHATFVTDNNTVWGLSTKKLIPHKNLTGKISWLINGWVSHSKNAFPKINHTT